MEQQFFEGLTCEASIKARYKDLAKQYHPDLGGDTEMMKLINAQYEKVLTGRYQSEGKSLSEIDELLAKDLILRDRLNKILLIEGLLIEVCGSWIWVTGDTKTHKDKLKEAGFLFSANKLAWYWRSGDRKSYNRSPSSLELIRYRYGTLGVKKDESRMAIA